MEQESKQDMKTGITAGGAGDFSGYTPVYPVDLHCHSTRSDGADTPQELIDHAAALGMKVIAITDHDIRPPRTITIGGTGESVDAADYARSKGLCLLRGIEISCETTAEDCHIVCLGCDWEDPFFDALERSVVESKTGSYRELVRRLNEDGMKMTWEEVLENGGNPVCEDQVQKKMIFELIARKGYCKDWSAAKLMVKNTPAYQILRKKPDPVDVIREVHRCGGIAIMAHPYLVNEPVCLPRTAGAAAPAGDTQSPLGMSLEIPAEMSSEKLSETPAEIPSEISAEMPSKIPAENQDEVIMDRAAYIDRLIVAGLDGIEACYSYAKTSYGGNLTQEQIECEVRERYTGRVALLSGGSDYHADFKKGVKPEKARVIGECGIIMEYFEKNELLRRIARQG